MALEVRLVLSQGATRTVGIAFVGGLVVGGAGGNVGPEPELVIGHRRSRSWGWGGVEKKRWEGRAQEEGGQGGVGEGERGEEVEGGRKVALSTLHVQ